MNIFAFKKNQTLNAFFTPENSCSYLLYIRGLKKAGKMKKIQTHNLMYFEGLCIRKYSFCMVSINQLLYKNKTKTADSQGIRLSAII